MDKMAIFVTGDHHFSHRKIIQYSSRPFASIEEHDEALIAAWNKTVSINDTVYHLGDFTLGDKKKARSFFDQLNGTIKVLGNSWHHDKSWLKAENRRSIPFHFDNSRTGGSVTIELPIVVFEEIKIVKGQEQRLVVVMCHYPFREWDRSHYGSIHFHAHSHGALPWVANRLDVGVDNAFKLTGEYRPFELYEAVSFSQMPLLENIGDELQYQ
jgi:calcineurin-like phosphoesterase family protein